MERLTKRGTDGQAMMDCEKCKADWTGKNGKPEDESIWAAQQSKSNRGMEQEGGQ